MRTVVYDFVTGTLLLDVTDPNGDDNGPGTYAYPTSRQLPARRLRPPATSRSTTTGRRHLPRADVATCRRPSAARSARSWSTSTCTSRAPSPTSTAASFPQRNYSIAPGYAWSRLIEVQGFGQRYVDAQRHDRRHGRHQGERRSRATSRSRVPKAALGGTPAAGWAFTVVLTGQDGFSADQARGFQPTPQDFQFGVCAPGGSDPLCGVDPNRCRRRST